MPIVITSKIRYKGTITPSGLNVETTVIEISPRSDEYMVEGYIDLGNMQYGDVITIKEYISVDGTNVRTFIEKEYADEQKEPIIRFYTKTIDRDSTYKVTIKQTSGVIRSFPYVFFREDFGMA